MSMETANDNPTSETLSPVDEIIPYIEPEVNPSKTGNKPKQLVAIEVYGYEVGRGKTKRIINPDDVYKLAALGCTNQEICTWFDVNKDTLQYTFGEIIDKGREDLKLRLRRAQLDLAINGKNPAMLIWLGKNLLGQQENPGTGEANQPLPFNDEGL